MSDPIPVNISAEHIVAYGDGSVAYYYATELPSRRILNLINNRYPDAIIELTNDLDQLEEFLTHHDWVDDFEFVPTDCNGSV